MGPEQILPSEKDAVRKALTLKKRPRGLPALDPLWNRGDCPHKSFGSPLPPSKSDIVQRGRKGKERAEDEERAGRAASSLS